MTCQVRKCQEAMRPGAIVCDSCWRLRVPGDVRDAVFAAWKRKNRWMSTSWCRLVGRAVSLASRVKRLEMSGMTVHEALAFVETARSYTRQVLEEC
jgi:hypothetical protein